MRSRILLILMSMFSIMAYSEEVIAKVIKDTDIYSDYEQNYKIGVIKKNEQVIIQRMWKAHDDDSNYWGFDLLINQGSIRVSYKSNPGYVDFSCLAAVDDGSSKLLHNFSNKVLVPAYYCDTLYYMTSKYIEDVDPFVLKYEQHIKYVFLDDVYEEWFYNYPINYSFLNDLYFQISAIPSRYSFKAFILSLTKDTIVCIIDNNVDQLGLYDSIEKFECGKKYQFTYFIDGDYVSMFYDGQEIFHGVYVEKETWDYIYKFMKRRLMKTKQDQAMYDDVFSKQKILDLEWPHHSDGYSEYRK